MKEEIQKEINALTQKAIETAKVTESLNNLKLDAPCSLSDQIKTKQQGDKFMKLLNAI